MVCRRPERVVMLSEYLYTMCRRCTQQIRRDTATKRRPSCRVAVQWSMSISPMSLMPFTYPLYCQYYIMPV